MVCFMNKILIKLIESNSFIPSVDGVEYSKDWIKHTIVIYSIQSNNHTSFDTFILFPGIKLLYLFMGGKRTK